MIKSQTIDKTIIAVIGAKMFQKTFPTSEERERVYQILLNTDESDLVELAKVKAIFSPELSEAEEQLKIDFDIKKEESQKMLDILDFMKSIKEKGHSIFEVVENTIRVKGINISIPELLVRELMLACKEREQALLNFWKLCALNPDPRARFDLFRFLTNHKLTITPSGHFIAYRTVNIKEQGDSNLEAFVTQEFLKVKRWKKAPKSYNILHDVSDDTYECAKTESSYANNFKVLGNLAEMYENIGSLSGNVYTDAHTGTMTIKMGEPVSMPREAVDPDNNNSCSYGLHLGNEDFMRNNMGYFGKVGVVALVNPKNVTSVPVYDSGKMRTCEYLPISIAEIDENNHIVPVDIEVFDYEYAQNTLEELEEIAKLSSRELEEYKKHEFIALEVDFKMLKVVMDSVTMSVSEANNKLKNRVITIN